MTDDEIIICAYLDARLNAMQSRDADLAAQCGVLEDLCEGMRAVWVALEKSDRGHAKKASV